MFVRLGLKSLTGTNTLAYYENSVIVDVKSFTTLAPEAYVIKLSLQLNNLQYYTTYFLSVAVFDKVQML